MSARAPGVHELSLPDQLLLLLHKPRGRLFSGVKPHDVVAAAEAAELVLRGRGELRRKLFGKADLVLLDRSPVGVEWIDRNLELLAFRVKPRSASIPFRSWFLLRREAFTEHRARLCAAGYFQHRRDKLLGFLPYERYFPDEAGRAALLAELSGIASGESYLDDRTALLVALAYSSGLGWEKTFERRMRDRLRVITRGKVAGDAVSEAVVLSCALIGSFLTPPRRGIGGDFGGGGYGGGGDGGGGDGGAS